ncbi:MAG: multidrug efflux RND transporter permease subunit [Sphingobium sp.]|nr:multidrug efflux RND transporter permease subunit [Sphingobium sp.]
MSRLFIDRPILAWVLAIIVMLCGIGGVMGLPVAQYPDIAPVQVQISANYPGASAETVQTSVTQVIEQSLQGIDGLLYFSSSSSSSGGVGISATFTKGTDPDIAQVQVQNQLQSVIARLPQPVQQRGVTVRKSNPDQLLVVAVYDKTDKMSPRDVSDYLSSNIEDTIGRVQGVGNSNVFGSPHAMRIWLDPNKLASYQLMPSDVTSAITAQNNEVAAGEIGGTPSGPDQYLNATVKAQGRLQTAEQFGAIVLKTSPDGAVVRLSDVARVELGSDNYNIVIHVNGHNGAGISVSLAPGADALKTAEAVKATVRELSKDFPPGLTYAFVNDSTNFIKLSVKEVVWTLIEAIILVVIVMFLFLQSWRATLIPTIAVPVVLLGTFGIFYVLGYSINTLTLFGLVLSIGLLVDDAIVVVENVKRLMEEYPEMSPRDATIESMHEITMALIAIALVLSAVFLPMAFFGGSVGVIYRQFSVTLVSAMLLSIFVALVLTPALTANLLKQAPREGEVREPGWLERHFPGPLHAMQRFGDGFNDRFGRSVQRYLGAVNAMVNSKLRSLAVYALIVGLLVILFHRLPTGFLPVEDQGIGIVTYQLPSGATMNRTAEVQKAVEDYFKKYESSKIDTFFTLAGTSGGGGANGQNVGRGFIVLKPWDERPDAKDAADKIAQRATRALSGLRDAEVFALLPPAIRGLGQANGFTVELLNSGNLSREAFENARDKLVAAARTNPRLAAVRLSELPDTATLKIDIDQAKLTALGLNINDVNNTLSTAWGGRYVNDFVDKDRVKRVWVMGDAPYRSKPEDLSQWQVRGANGQMAPFSAFAQIGWSSAPSSLSRFNGIPSFEINGQAAPGYSSGDAMRAMEDLAKDIPGTSIFFSGLSYQERLSSGQAPMLYAISLLVVFLFLAALYESWSIPVAVLLIVPLGLVGAVLAVTLRGLINDIFLQIGLLTTMGLAAKNAILMIEFAEQAEKRGVRIIEAALEAARLRLRPILMTSMAFICGVFPLAIAGGAGANSRIAIGTAVVGGMLTAMLLAIFYIPLFFVIVRRTTRDVLKMAHAKLAERRARRQAR